MPFKNWLKALKLNEATVSTLLGALVVIVVGVLIFNYFSKLGKEGVELEEITEEAAGAEEVSLEEAQPPAGLPTTHKVVLGETLWSIAEKYFNSGYNWVDIATENSLVNANYIEEGQELTVPAVAPKLLAKLPETGVQVTDEPGITGSTYTVQKSDCLWEIAVRAYGDGFRWVEIAQANNLASPDIIHAGNEFVLPR